MHFSNVTLPCHPLCSEKEWCEIVKKKKKKASRFQNVLGCTKEKEAKSLVC